MEYMAFEEFVEKVKKEKPILFELEHDEIPDEKSVKMFQKENNIKLQKKYCDFLMGFGGAILASQIYIPLINKAIFILFQIKVVYRIIIWQLQTMDVVIVMYFLKIVIA